VILLDVNMPDIDGFETAALIRQHKKTAHTPIIFITAYADEVLTARGYSLGAADYILTPVVPEILRTKVRVFVEIYQMRAQMKRQAEAERAQLVALVEASQEWVAVTDLSGRVSYINPAGRRLLGLEQDTSASPTVISNYYPRSAFDLVQNQAIPTAVRDGVWLGETALLHRNGHEIPVTQTIVAHKDPQGGVQYLLIVARDITERKRAETALFEEKELAQVTLASIGDAVITTDALGRVASLNPMAEQLLGCKHGEALGLHVSEVLTIVDETTQTPLEDPVQYCLRQGTSIHSADRAVLIRPDTQRLAIDHSAAPIRDQQGNRVGAVLVFRDVTRQRELTRQIFYHATHDALTGIVNRREFERRLGLMLRHAKEHQRRHALCYLDLDQFKLVNDTCGHTAGDTLLRQLAAVLRTRMRERDTLARLGGDEFGVLLGECPLDQALRIAHGLREAIQDFRFTWEDKPFALGVSIGLVPIDYTSGDLQSVLSAADSACYVAKEKGRNRVHVNQPGDHELAQRQGEMQWIARLHQALAEDRFCLYYQPIVPLAPAAHAGDHGEILLRLKEPDGQVILPGAFIPAAERYNQITAIDRWVIRAVLSALRDQEQRPPLSQYSINISGQSLGDAAFLAFVVEQVEQATIEPSQICFEITETAAIANLTAAMNFVSTLKAKGCRFALDDFGSGLSSFAYLKTLPVDYLKIDGRFVKDMLDEPIDCAMVEAIHRVGHLMGIKTNAESVENTAILEKLRVIGVDYAQGYGIAKPRPFGSV
jgi:diguanylate cyclase (GGDEF)-like protein/PAS domain S-box-containing protein